jgi:hypothetical protein
LGLLEVLNLLACRKKEPLATLMNINELELAISQLPFRKKIERQELRQRQSDFMTIIILY